MPTTYQEAPADVIDLAAGILRKNHPDLVQAEVTIKYLFASNNEAPAIMHHGWPAKALVKINNLRDRVAGLDDATIIIDANGWEEWDAKHRKAVLDHELQHVQVKRNKVGAIVYDDANRPRLFLQPHDFEIAGFHSIVSRHGAAAQESRALVKVREVWIQHEFEFEEVAETVG